MNKTDKAKKAKTVIFAGIVIIIFSICLFQINGSTKSIIDVMSTGTENKKIEWGIKRNNKHEQPDVGEQNKQVLESNGGICLGNDIEKIIYLTFDSGYEAGHMGNILDTLKSNDIKAAFFVTSHYVNSAPEMIQRMINEGHIVGNHTVNHKSMPEISNEEIEKEVMQLHQAVYEKYGYEMRYIRPPKGEYNERTIKKCEELGYKTVMWSFAYCDWDEKKQPSVDEAKKKITENFHSGEIMLLHSNSETNAKVLDTIIKEAKNDGYEFKTLDEFK